MIKINKGLSLPIEGEPVQQVGTGQEAGRVALVGFDYHGLKPTMEVAQGDRVRCGQLLFADKKNAGVRFTSPASGIVQSINRGEKRVFQSIVIAVEGDEHAEFASWAGRSGDSWTREQAQALLLESGEWTALRTRPFSKVPAPNTAPHSIFVTAMDTHPLAPDPAVIIREEGTAFSKGVEILAGLTDGRVHVCTEPSFQPTLPAIDTVEHHTFSGPHPAGLAGTHIHHLDPVHAGKTVWTIGYQDVIAWGHLFASGRKYNARVVAVGGPGYARPRLIRTRTGACISELVGDELTGKRPRMISGSVFGGRHARGAVDYLGRYANQITVLEEGHEREFLGWLSPGLKKFSILNIYLSSLNRSKKLPFTTTTNGSERAMVPIGTYERVMPLDILPTQLLRSLIVGDTEMAQKLGALELDEEDLSLCTFVCPGKYEYGPILRRNLALIEKEG